LTGIEPTPDGMSSDTSPGPSSEGAGKRSLDKAALDFHPEGGKTRVVFSGSLTARTLDGIEKQLAAGLAKNSGPFVFDLQKLSLLDTSGALLLNLAMKKLQDAGVACSLEHADGRRQELLKKSVLPETDANKQAPPPPKGLTAVLATLGKAVCDTGSLIVQLVGFLGQFLITAVILLRHPTQMRWTSLIFQMEQVGLRAVPIVSLLTFLIGLVVAYMGAQQLSMFGADIFAVNLLEVTVLREMAVLITAIVVAGRSSSSFTAQIGAMVANEEVAALRSMGLDPGTLLVVPRVLALVLTLPMLVFIADIMALFGGAVAIRFTIDLSFSTFISQFEQVAKLDNFLVGIIKTPFFAMSIGLVGCFQGFRATGSAESVGFLTTISVVQSIFIVILLDALFAIFFSNVGM